VNTCRWVGTHAKLFVESGVGVRFRPHSSTQLNDSLASLVLSKGSLARKSKRPEPSTSIKVSRPTSQQSGIRSIRYVMRLFTSANSFRSISRSQWFHAIPHYRCFHLLGATSPGDVPPRSRREILDIYPADVYQSPSKIHIYLRTYSDSRAHGMSLGTALSKFAKPGKLLLPIPQSKIHKVNDVQQYHFKRIDTGSFLYHINPWGYNATNIRFVSESG
jgi:hypothetical protein